MKKTTGLWLVGAALLVGLIGYTGLAGGSTVSTPPTQAQIQADIASGKAHVIPEGPGNWSYASSWQGCRFVVIKMHSTHYSDNGAEIAIADSTPAQLAAQAPPPVQCAPRPPTAAEIAADKANMEALAASTRPPGLAPFPTIPSHS